MFDINAHTCLLIFVLLRKSNLQKKLDELKDYQAYSDEWFQLSSKVELEKSSRDRKDFTIKAYREFMANFQSE